MYIAFYFTAFGGGNRYVIARNNSGGAILAKCSNATGKQEKQEEGKAFFHNNIDRV